MSDNWGFKDWDTFQEWVKPWIKRAVESGLMQGYDDGTFKADKPITRGEMAVVAVRLFDLIRATVAEEAEEMANYDRRKLLERIADAVVEVKVPGEGIGAGVFLKGGYVLTNAHVVSDRATAYVRWVSDLASADKPKVYGSAYPVVAKDGGFDLALIRVPTMAEAAGYAILDTEWGDADIDAVNRKFYGERLYTVGSPLGISGAMSEGLFAGIKFYSSICLTFSGSINPGNSGGGIWNADGKLVSIVTSKPSDALVDGLGFGVPMMAILRFLKEAGVQV